MPSGINPSLGCSPITGCTSKDYYIPGRGVRAPQQSNTKGKWGAVGGAAIGAYMGRGDPLLSAGGAVLGMVIGYEIGSTIDKIDEMYATHMLRGALNNNTDGQMTTWQNPDKQETTGVVGPITTNGNCREFVSTIQVAKEKRKVKGTACMKNNEWVLKELYQ